MTYTSKLLKDGVYEIQGSKQATMYLIEGKKESMVIDSGMEEDSLKEYLSSITNKPLYVVITHGHIDHISKCGEFSKVYMNLKDKEMYLKHSVNNDSFGKMKMTVKPINEVIEMPERFDLGNKIIEVVPLAGHTPGSVLLVDTTDKVVFTGDAIGSGCGVLMLGGELGSLSLSEYKEGLLSAIRRLEELNVDDSWKFCGGHSGQEMGSRVQKPNFICMKMLKDMIQLCDELLNNKAYTEKFIIKNFGLEAIYARSGVAEMQLNDVVIK